MAMTGGSSGGPQAEINMTPMIDVLLVLLIIFLVIQPALQRGIKVEVPAVRQAETTETPEQVILRIEAGPTYRINGEAVSLRGLEERLDAALEGRSERVVFVSGGENLSYGQVVQAIDVARRSNIQMIGLLPRSHATGTGGATP